ncbi:MAG: sn-glycerol-3-phosphate ABC transporter ATP-binding protein UgpC, partial [Candidatus Sumerlaeia bacterium]|nr:sn-glycerol-3-phosphate ABC transporter ATP-binding protein UgpC [Candidatus Sumerlaeia bacterium]
EFCVFVGPSGCGKSTTLRMIAGLEEITRGELRIGDRVVNDLEPKNRDIAMVFQNYALYPHMNVYKNMASGLMWRNCTKEEIDRRVREAAKILAIEEYLNRKPGQLSGGQRQRVALGRAIVRQPQVFLFDEPLSNLDAKFRVMMRQEISRLHDTLKTTMIYVTHDQVEAMTMGEKIVVMKDGIIHQVADPLTLYREPRNQFVAGFIGSPPMNFLKGRVESGEGDTLHFTDGGLRIPISSITSERLRKANLPDGSVTMGIRPESLSDAATTTPESFHHALEMKVEILEPMGSETIAYLQSAKSRVTAKISADSNPEVKGTLQLLVDTRRMHFFHPVTEESL